MVDDAETIELAEGEVARLVDVCHKQGLTYWQILGLLWVACQNLYAQADAEDYLKHHKTH